MQFLAPCDCSPQMILKFNFLRVHSNNLLSFLLPHAGDLTKGNKHTGQASTTEPHPFPLTLLVSTEKYIG